MRKFGIACIGGLLLVCAVATRARTVQTPAANSAGCEAIQFRAEHLNGTEVKFNIVVPSDYLSSDRCLPVLYLLHGYTGHYSDWNKQTIKENPGVQRAILDDFGPLKNPARKDEDPFLLIRKLTPKSCPQLYLAIG